MPVNSPTPTALTEPAPVPVQQIDTAEGIAALAASLSKAERLAVDIESNGLHAFRARLCTVQIAAEVRPGVVESVSVVDPIGLPDSALAPLALVLGPQGPVKLIHDLSFDARMLWQHGVAVGNVYDTSVAARMLGLKSTGLMSLAELRLGLRLSKKMQQNDWGHRPLKRDELAYLASDVSCLPALARSLEADVAAAGLVEEVAEETRYRLASALQSEEDHRPAYVRIKGSEKLPAPVQAILREVAEVREREAERLDVPPFKVLGNEQLLELANRPPASVPALTQIRGLQHRRAVAISGQLFEGVQRGLAAKDIPAAERAEFFTPPPPPPREQVTARRAREARLTAWRREEAHRRKVDEQAILPGHCLQDIATRAPADREALASIAGVGNHRVQRYAEPLLKAVRG